LGQLRRELLGLALGVELHERLRPLPHDPNPPPPLAGPSAAPAGGHPRGRWAFPPPEGSTRRGARYSLSSRMTRPFRLHGHGSALWTRVGLGSSATSSDTGRSWPASSSSILQSVVTAS